MAKITLRAYTREIEQMIEEGKSTEAILHCHQILTFFLKHAETYRLLGKAFLDTKQFDLAEMVFNQVLTIFPDDFISHLGLSLIYEGRNELNDAVEQMERAFELQPANAMIQDELKRLYRLRDGIEPPRIRLTRGALIKMYARSNLFQQAIAELRIAMHEHPQRLDLETELVRMLYLSGQKIEAIEQAIKIIAQYPYCYEPNRILSQALLEDQTIGDVNLYKKRLNSIDPYMAYTSEENPDVYSIPDIAFSVDYLDTDQYISESPLDWIAFIQDSWREESDLNPEIHDENISIESIDQRKSDLSSPEQEDRSSIQDNTDAGVPDWLSLGEKEPLVQQSNGEIPAQSGLSTEETPPIIDEVDLTQTEEYLENNQPFSIWTNEGNETTKIKSSPPSENNFPESSIESVKTEESETIQRYPEIILKDAHDALLSGHEKHSIECYQNLITNNQLIEKVISQLEEDLKYYPHITDLWLVLGDAYRLLGETQKALSAYQQAEKNVENKGEHESS